MCQKYLPSFHTGSFDDSRLELVIEDGRKYLERVDEQYDAIVIDVNDPLEGGPSYMLLRWNFIGLLPKSLKMMEYLSCSLAQRQSRKMMCLQAFVIPLGKVFNHVFPYVTYIPSYALQWGFVMATGNPGKLDIT